MDKCIYALVCLANQVHESNIVHKYTHTHKFPIFIAYVVLKIDTKLLNYVEEKSNK